MSMTSVLIVIHKGPSSAFFRYILTFGAGGFYGYAFFRLIKYFLNKFSIQIIEKYSILCITGGSLSFIMSLIILWPDHHIRQFSEASIISLSFGIVNGLFQSIFLNKFFRKTYLWVISYVISYFLIGDLWYRGKYFVEILDGVLIIFLSGILMGFSLYLISKNRRNVE